MDRKDREKRSRIGLFFSGAALLGLAIYRMVAQSGDRIVLFAIWPAILFMLAAFAPSGVDSVAEVADALRAGAPESKRDAPLTPEELKRIVVAAGRRWLAVGFGGLAVCSIFVAVTFAPFALYALVTGKSDHSALHGALLGAVTAWPFLELGKRLQAGG